MLNTDIVVLAVDTGVVVIVVAVAIVLVVLMATVSMRGRQRRGAQRRLEDRRQLDEAGERASRAEHERDVALEDGESRDPHA
jgi:signal transduction histidine kinase